MAAARARYRHPPTRTLRTPTFYASDDTFGDDTFGGVGASPARFRLTVTDRTVDLRRLAVVEFSVERTGTVRLGHLGAGSLRSPVRSAFRVDIIDRVHQPGEGCLGLRGRHRYGVQLIGGALGTAVPRRPMLTSSPIRGLHCRDRPRLLLDGYVRGRHHRASGLIPDPDDPHQDRIGRRRDLGDDVIILETTGVPGQGRSPSSAPEEDIRGRLRAHGPGPSRRPRATTRSLFRLLGRPATVDGLLTTTTRWTIICATGIWVSRCPL